MISLQHASSLWLSRLKKCTLLLQFKVNEVLLREGEVETVSCAVFIRKAFVTSHTDYNPEEVKIQVVDLDDVLYCSTTYRPTYWVSINTAASVPVPVSCRVWEQPNSSL